MIKNQTKYECGKTALLAFAVISVAVLPVLFMNEGKFFLVGDYMTQQIPFMKECRRVILSGKPFWSSNTFLGANFIGTYSFYIYGSPFFWPLLIIPERFMAYALSAVFVLKHVVAAMTANLYLSRHLSNKNYVLIGSLMYAFSSFTIDSSFYFHFIDVIAFFPLILYFTDEVLDNKKKPLLSLSALLCAVTNYYFFISTSFIFIFYLFFRIKYSEGKYNFKDAVRCIVSYGLGGLSAAVILIPSALSLLETSKATDSYSAKFITILSTFPQYIKFLEALTIPHEGILDSGSGFSYFIYSSTAAFLPFIGPIFYFIALKRKEKTWDFKLIKFFTVLTLIPLGNGLFSLFTNMTYTRWWYGFVLIMILVSLKIIDEMQDKPEITEEYKKSAKLTAAIASAVTFVPLIIKVAGAYVFGELLKEKLPASLYIYLKTSGFASPLDKTDLRYFLVLLILTLVSYLPLYLSIKRKWIFTSKVVPAVCVICTVLYGTYLFSEVKTFKERSPETFSEEAENALSSETVYSARVQNKKKLANFSMISNEPGISTFHSFKSHSTTEFGRITGYNIGQMPGTAQNFNTPAIQTVLSVKTIVEKDSSRSSAPYYVPMGYVYDYYIEDNCKPVSNVDENNKRIELMTAACYLDSETIEALNGVVRPLEDTAFDWKAEVENRRATACTGFVMNTEGFSAVSEGDDERLVYFSVPRDNGWTAYINGKETDIYTVNGGMMGIIVPAGRAEIEFKFMPPGLVIGAVVSVASLFAVAVYAATDYIFKKKKSKSI